jgi:hypothetical protein
LWDVGETADLGFAWRERGYPRQRWRRLFVRTVAHADVLAPDHCSYVVRVIRVLWPRGRWSGIPADWPVEVVEALPTLFAWRVVWA